MGLRASSNETATAARIVNITADFAPLRRFLTNDRMLLGLPSGVKFYLGVNIKHIPVKDLSNSLMETLIVPLAGSLMTAYFLVKPFKTTK